MKPALHKAAFKVDEGEKLTTLMHIGTSDDANASFEEQEKKALKDGHTIVHDDGRRVWRDRQPNLNLDAKGSAIYTWHEDGNRVRCTWFEYTSHNRPGHHDGNLPEKRKLRSCWVSFDKV